MINDAIAALAAVTLASILAKLTAAIAALAASIFALIAVSSRLCAAALAVRVLTLACSCPILVFAAALFALIEPTAVVIEVCVTAFTTFSGMLDKLFQEPVVAIAAKLGLPVMFVHVTVFKLPAIAAAVLAMLAATALT